jgi:hypothetical protein
MYSMDILIVMNPSLLKVDPNLNGRTKEDQYQVSFLIISKHSNTSNMTDEISKNRMSRYTESRDWL